jgi:hypothetical protein
MWSAGGRPAAVRNAATAGASEARIAAAAATPSSRLAAINALPRHGWIRREDHALVAPAAGETTNQRRYRSDRSLLCFTL